MPLPQHGADPLRRKLLLVHPSASEVLWTIVMVNSQNNFENQEEISIENEGIQLSDSSTVVRDNSSFSDDGSFF